MGKYLNKEGLSRLWAAVPQKALRVSNILPSGDDLNNRIAPGVYYSNSSSLTATLINCPVTDGFRLEIKQISNTAVSGNSVRIMQEIIGINVDMTSFYRRFYTKSGWTSWIKFSGTEV